MPIAFVWRRFRETRRNVWLIANTKAMRGFAEINHAVCPGAPSLIEVTVINVYDIRDNIKVGLQMCGWSLSCTHTFVFNYCRRSCGMHIKMLLGNNSNYSALLFTLYSLYIYIIIFFAAYRPPAHVTTIKRTHFGLWAIEIFLRSVVSFKCDACVPSAEYYNDDDHLCAAVSPHVFAECVCVRLVVRSDLICRVSVCARVCV